MEHLSKKPRTLPGRRQNSRWDMASSNHSPDQAMNKALARPEPQTETAIVQIPTFTFWTACAHCNAPQSCSMSAIGCLVRCQTCRRLFPLKSFPVDTNLAAQRISSVPWTLQNYGLSSSNGGAAKRMEHYGIQNQVKGSDANIGAMSVIRSPLAGEAQEKSSNPEESVPNSKTATDQLFRQGVQLMLKAFLARTEGASHDELGDLKRYGKIILQSIADLGIVDPGLGALLENLNRQAADVTARRSSVSLSEAAHASSTKTADAIHQEKLKALALMTAADEEVSTHMKQVERTKAALSEAREREEMAKKARIQAEEDLILQEQQLANKEASRDEARDALEERENTLAKAKLKQLNAEKEMLKCVEELKSSEDKWRVLCQQAPGSKNWIL
ncbi:uncharacterized protein LOC116254939 [Nymphaea colorata]|uniref:uncharacterized protein LOC116254939 n=1 Tax=Nymphaea colorata TaxID=210225 RepID=UPI00129E2ABB|nr:uncharacterized protein LOC116254939 [Nymphaea colorata]XP_049933981.1 uncharacterized protein LOC116254939 [Nymphaea colorata]